MLNYHAPVSRGRPVIDWAGGVSFVYREQVLPPDGWVVEPDVAVPGKGLTESVAAAYSDASGRALTGPGARHDSGIGDASRADGTPRPGLASTGGEMRALVRLIILSSPR